MLVKITKTSTSASPGIPAADWDSFVLGFANPHSLPVDYEIEGWLMEQIEIGHPLHVLRIRRNGVQALGEFRSSAVVAIQVQTGNSIYRIEPAESNGEASK